MTYGDPRGERLYALLPAIYRIRDEERGGPLKALLGALADQVAVLEDGLDQLYDDLFVETCAPWVLPYLGDLLGLEQLPPESLDPRGEVANTLGYRRRKGTAPMLEQLAQDVTGLPARGVEFFEHLATTQHMNHPRPGNVAFASLRQAARLEEVHGPFERLNGASSFTHTAEVRSPRRGGRYNLPHVGVFLWRIRPYRVGRTPAVQAGSDARFFRFDPLGRDVRLFHLPQTEDELTHLAEPANVPHPIGRRAFAAALGDYYGRDRSLLVEFLPDDADERQRPGAEWPAVPPADVVPADLSVWAAPAAGKVAIDPVLGRIAFGTARGGGDPPVVVTFHAGFSADVGGGEYGRGASTAGEGAVVRVSAMGTDPGALPTLDAALAALPFEGGVVEIADSGRYELPAEEGGGAVLRVGSGERRLTLRAADGARPTLRVPGSLRVIGGPDDSLTLDGLWISGGPLVVERGADGRGLGSLRIRHCTLPPAPGAAALRLLAIGTRLEVERSVLGPLHADLDSIVRVTDSVIDAGAEDGVAYTGKAGPSAHPTAAEPHGAALEVERCTVVGQVRADALVYASNSIFLASLAPGDAGRGWTAPVTVRRRQEGAVRYSYLPLSSRVPRRFRCVPDEEGSATLRPSFTSLRWGDPGYAQLSPATPEAIRRGADDESEMGVFHDLFLPLREAHLRARLGESLRFGQEAGLYYAS